MGRRLDRRDAGGDDGPGLGGSATVATRGLPAAVTEERAGAGATPSVELRGLSKAFGGVVAVDGISLAVGRGEFLTLLGPSGCGKTTTLRLIGGFEVPTAGEVVIGGEAMGGRPPHRRPVNTVFQHYALFPHMTVGRNVGYGLEMAGIAKPERARRVEEALELVRLPGIAGRRPAELSGGQRQRVALARALVNRPAVLLLDEPLGALDLGLRRAMQGELTRLNREVGATFVYVTHDQDEALTMSDRVAVMNEGRVVQVGTPKEVYERPRNRFVAGFVGETNLLEGRVRHVDGEETAVEVPGSGVLRAVAAGKVAVGERATVAVRPEQVALWEEVPPGAADWNAVDGVLAEVDYLGPRTRYVVRLAGGARMAVSRQNRGGGGPEPRPGEAVRVGFAVGSATLLGE